MAAIERALALLGPRRGPARIGQCVLAASLVILGLGTPSSAARLGVPRNGMASLEQPYSVLLHLCFAPDLGFTPAMRRLTMDYAVEMLGREWGEVVSIQRDEAAPRGLATLIQAKGLSRVLAGDLTDTPVRADRALLVHVRKRWNSCRMTMREWNPGHGHLSAPAEVIASDWRGLGRGIVEWALAELSFEGYLVASSSQECEVTVMLKAGRFLNSSGDVLTNRGRDSYFRVVKKTLDRSGRVVEREALELEMLKGEFNPKQGWSFQWVGIPSPRVRRQKRTCYQVYRVHLKPDRKRVIRLVSQQNRNRPLQQYTVRQSQVSFDDTSQPGSQSDVDGCVTIQAAGPEPVLVSVRRRNMTLKKFVLAVQDGAPVLAITVPEANPEYIECYAELKKIDEDMDAQRRLATAVYDELTAYTDKQKYDDTLKCVAKLDESWPTESMFAGRIDELEKRCQAQGGILMDHIAPLRDKLRDVVAAKPDCDAIVKQIKEAQAKLQEAAAGVDAANRLEEEAAQLQERLDFAGAVQKLKQAIEAAPVQAARLQQRIAELEPKGETHEQARSFVKNRLARLTMEEAGRAAAEIRSHLQELGRVDDKRFLAEGCKLVNNLAKNALNATEKVLQKENPTDKDRDDGERYYKAYEALDTILKDLEGQKK